MSDSLSFFLTFASIIIVTVGVFAFSVSNKSEKLFLNYLRKETLRRKETVGVFAFSVSNKSEKLFLNYLRKQTLRRKENPRNLKLKQSKWGSGNQLSELLPTLGGAQNVHFYHTLGSLPSEILSFILSV